MRKSQTLLLLDVGFLGIYHVGVASCLREYAPPDTIQHLIGGASAGAMVAALLLCEAPLVHYTYLLTLKFISLSLAFCQLVVQHNVVQVIVQAGP
ncbi:bmm [Bugula neritina]|uniref:Bmm n=1 Tax=Bugula neritina TaxID=10212 RepID=A0A7J7JMH0_BUGNE|nr:bmm [Bugula neritina]